LCAALLAGTLGERNARSELDAAEQKRARLKQDAAAQSLAADLAEAARTFKDHKEGADRRLAEVTARGEEARGGREAAVRALDEAQMSHAAGEKEMANTISTLRLEAEKATWA
jgi:hypothetical protein